MSMDTWNLQTLGVYWAVHVRLLWLTWYWGPKENAVRRATFRRSVRRLSFDIQISYLQPLLKDSEHKESASLLLCQISRSIALSHELPFISKSNILHSTTMSCELSPSASAFSTMLSAFVGSVINGLCSGMFIAFITGWISWLSVIRILAAGIYELHLTIKAGTNFNAVDTTPYQNISMERLNDVENPTHGLTADAQPTGAEDVDAQSTTPQNPTPGQLTLTRSFPFLTTPGKQPATTLISKPLAQLDQTVTPFGWLGWTWSAIYTPLSQTIWVSVHITSADGIQQFVRALAIGVSALGLTFDYKQRYAAALGRRWGGWAFVAFNAWNAGACLLLGVEALALLIHGAMRIEDVPVPLVVLYPVFAIVWAVASWMFLPPVDGARGGNVVAGVLMGAFAGLFVAAPAFGLWQNAKFDEDTDLMMSGSKSSGLGLGDFLACESASVWAKFAAIMP